MNAVMQFLQATISPVLFIFIVLNLAAMGLMALMPDVEQAAYWTLVQCKA
jgi:hypothetical protein